MDNEEKRKEKRQNLLIVLGLIALIGLMGGLTYAFFNYNKTGEANLLKLGNIEFSSNYDSITLGNAFPVPKSSIQNSGTGMSDLTVSITGKTTYAGGLDYRIKAVEVSVEAGEKNIPISLHVSQDGLDSNGNEIMLFSFEDGAQVSENAEFAAGHIVQGTTRTQGSVMLKAYVDAASVVISDTYQEEGGTDASFGTGKTVLTTEEWNELQGDGGGVSFKIKVDAEEGNDVAGAIGYVSYNKNGLQGVTPQRQSIMDGESLTITGSLNVPGFLGWAESANATTPDYTVGQVVTFNESKTLYAVIDNPGSIDTCPGCKFVFVSSEYQYGGANNSNATLISNMVDTVTNDYRTLNKNYFIGFTETQDGKIDRAFACGIKGENPNQGTAFCVEGTIDDNMKATVYANNQAIVNTIYGTENSVCTESTNSSEEYQINCTGSITTLIMETGYAGVKESGRECRVRSNKTIRCS